MRGSIIVKGRKLLLITYLKQRIRPNYNKIIKLKNLQKKEKLFTSSLVITEGIVTTTIVK